MKTVIATLLLLLAGTHYWSSAFAQNPTYQWSGGLLPKNSTGECRAFGTVVDASGNVYTAGYFKDTADFNPGSGTANLGSNGGQDIFVCKLDAAGNYLWAKGMGGTGNDGAYSIAVDGSGNVYTTGNFNGTVDFDPGSGTANLTSNGGTDIFVSKLDASGNYVWARSIGGSGNDVGYGVAVDGSGNVFTTGSFSGTADFNPGSGTANLTSNGGDDIFVSKLDGTGNYVWAKNIGGTGSDLGSSLALDGSSNVYTTGYYSATADFDPGSGTANLTSNGGYELFVSKLDNSGSYVWAKSMGGSAYDGGGSIAVDGSGNVYTTGYFGGTVDFDPGTGTANLTCIGLSDMFVSKLSASGAYVWAKSIGNSAGTQTQGHSIAIDASGNVYTAGDFSGTTDFDPGAGTASLTSNGVQDIFVCKLNSSGNYVWAKNIGGTGIDLGFGLALDGTGDVYSMGNFHSIVDCDPGSGTATLTSIATGYSSFVAKWAQSGVGVSGITPDVVAVYPNPTTGLLTLRIPDVTEGATILVNDAAGKAIVVKTISKGAAPTTTIDLSSFTKGIYFVQARAGELNYRKKIVVQ
jgi:hypothetical protein